MNPHRVSFVTFERFSLETKKKKKKKIAPLKGRKFTKTSPLSLCSYSIFLSHVSLHRHCYRENEDVMIGRRGFLRMETSRGKRLDGGIARKREERPRGLNRPSHGYHPPNGRRNSGVLLFSETRPTDTSMTGGVPAQLK